MSDKTEVKILTTAELPAALKNAFARIFGLEEKIDALKEEHITPLAAEKTAAWRDLKASTDMNRKDLELWFKIYKRACLAEQMDDEDEGRRIKDSLKRIYRALQKGQTLDWIDGLNAAEEDEPEEEADPLFEGEGDGRSLDDSDDDISDVAPMSVSDGSGDGEADDVADAPGADWGFGDDAPGVEEFSVAGKPFNEGREAARSGIDVDDCPYDGRTVQGRMWRKGFEAAARDGAAIPQVADGVPTAALH